MMPKIAKWAVFVPAVLLLVGLGAFGTWLYAQRSANPPCTAEAKLCPDGTAVGRRGPKCEFAPCPTGGPQKITIYCTTNACAAQEINLGAGSLTRNCFRSLAECRTAASVCTTGESCTGTTSPAGWQVFTDAKQGFEFAYPPKLATTYIDVPTEGWPPVVTVATGSLVCRTSTSTGGGEPTVSRKAIAGQDYCVTSRAEGAAGSTYTTYIYATARTGRLLQVSFVLRTPQCLNYDQPRQGACLKEQQAFSVDQLASQILASVRFR